MDIRNFFAPKSSGVTAKQSDNVNGSKTAREKPKPVLSDSSDEEESHRLQSKKKRTCPSSKKKQRALSDSDDDFKSSGVEKKKVERNGHGKKSEDKSSKLEPVKVEDFFASAPKTATLPKIPKKEKTGVVAKDKNSDAKKRKSPENDDMFADADFENMVQDIDFDIVQPSPVKKSKTSETASGATIAKKLASKAARDETKPKLESSSGSSKDEKKKTVKKEIVETVKEKAIVPTKLKEKEPEIKPKMTKVTKAEPPKEASSYGGQGPSQPMDSDSKLWVEKYKPTTTKSIIGQQGASSNLQKLLAWLQNWHKNNSGTSKKSHPKPPPWNSGADNGFWAKAALLSGPPGVGKTTTAYLVAKELGYDVMELNASDTRSKKSLGAEVSDALNSQSLSKVSTKRILLMDEVDGMAGNEDRGGVAELILLLKSSRIPVICMCNDRNHPKIRSLANHCFDLRFHRPRVEQIRAAMMSICFKEKLKISPEALNELITGCNQDIRQVLHHLSMIKAKDMTDSVDGKFSQEDAKKEAEKSKKTSIKIGPWDVCRKVFSAHEQESMSLTDKSDLFFHDYSIGPLFVQENYLAVAPHAAKNDPKKSMLLISKAADSICDGDLVERLIRSQNSWSLLPVQAMYSSVLPGEYMSGHVQGQIQFPNWLGKYSKQNKMERLLQELQMHTRLSAGLSKRSLNEDFVQQLRDSILRPMIKTGSEGIAEGIKVMSHYSLLREDLDSLLEVCQWPDKPDPMKNIESKVKAAFTRTYNKEVVLPYATTLGTISKRNATLVASDELLGADDEAEEDQEDESVENDAMIKAKKPKASKAVAEASSAKPARGGGKGGRGRGKK